MRQHKINSYFGVFLLLFCLSVSFTASPVFAKKRLKVGVLSSAPPYSFVAIQDGKKVVRGFVIDKWQIVAKILGVKVRFIVASDHAERKQMLRDGKIDLMAGGTEYDARELGLAFIDDNSTVKHHLYTHSLVKSVTCQRDFHCKKIVYLAGVNYSPEIKLRDDMLKLNSNLEALSMVDRGEADVYIAYSENSADYVIDRNRLTHVHKKGLSLAESKHGFLVDKNDKQLIADFHAVVKKMEEQGVNEVLKEKWFGYSVIRKNFLEQHARSIIIIISATALTFFLIMLWSFSLKRRVAHATSELQKTEQRYRSLIESSPDMIFLVDDEGCVIHSNKRARNSLKLPDSDQPFNLSKIMACDQDLLCFINLLFSEGCSRYDCIMIGSDDQEIDVEIAGSAIGMLDGTKLYACLFARDVTERNRLEMNLVQSERLAIIGKMAASVAHEINNPLGIIQANAQELMYEEVSEDVQEALTAIKRNAVRAGSITKDLLELASPKPISSEKLNVEDVIKGGIALLGPKVKTNNISIEIKDGPLFIHGDDRSLQQVLVNLLFNAQAHSEPDSPIDITVYENTIGADGTLRIIVRDHGKGIEKENLQNVFEPFFSKRKGGFGLGLFITRRIVERHNGIIFAQSLPGKGTAINMEFPAYKKE